MIGPVMPKVLAAVAVTVLVSACAQLDSPATHSEPPGSTSNPEQTRRAVNPGRFGGAANYFTNPSFEGVLKPWEPWGPNSLAEVITTARKAGRASVRVSAKSPAPYGLVEANVVGLPRRNDRFILSVWVRSADRPKSVIVILGGSRPNKPSVVIAKATRNVASAWRRISVGGRIRQPTLLGLDVFILVQSSIGAEDAFFMDAASLTSD
jgi:hypothetical protein